MRALWSDRPNCSHNLSQKLKCIRRFSDWGSRPPRLRPWRDHAMEKKNKNKRSQQNALKFTAKRKSWTFPLDRANGRGGFGSQTLKYTLKTFSGMGCFPLPWVLHPPLFFSESRALVSGSLELFNLAWKFQSGVAPANQTKGRAKTKSSWISPIFVNSGVFSSGKQARFTLNFCSGMPLWKVHELTLPWSGLPGPLLIQSWREILIFFFPVFGPLGLGGSWSARWFRAALKGTNLRGQTPISGFLRVPAVFCGFLRKSAVFCENLRFPNALFSRKWRGNLQKSTKIYERARFVPLDSPP